MNATALPRALSLALAQLADRRILGILVLALVIAVLVTGPFLLVIVGIAAVIDWIPSPAGLWGGETSEQGGGWVRWSSWLFWTYIMSPLAVAIIGALLEPIVEAVEARHYPHLPKVRRRGAGEVIGYALRFLGLMLGVSLAAWVIAWLTGLPAALLFVLAGGYLIAREYFETVALRRVPTPEAKAAFRTGILPLCAVGLLVGLGLNIPVVQLVAPLIGVAAFTHLYHASPS
ncbi:membrane protein [Candidatus Rhodobacter oscarellae]|uniref:Membrane protein n=1 Tax=Candidatus Rhodobacter oscarellae TaxID=1675527 RepID=A0A0J9GZ02_9RHOB|nr:EI24 domain-containing protein [Candidatus Rhodobacter lobularis]KMW58693.1 membrane protein [Candidatus Rhodobacter lobularis]